MDAVTAFVQGDLDEEIYMQQSGNWVPFEQSYGLNQSSHAWNAKLDAALKKLPLYTCLYYKFSGDKIQFDAIYVDDLILFSNNEDMRDEIKAKLRSIFRMKVLDS